MSRLSVAGQHDAVLLNTSGQPYHVNMTTNDSVTGDGSPVDRLGGVRRRHDTCETIEMNCCATYATKWI